jgi:hypothetical protein
MKRIILMLTVAAMFVVAMTVTAAPAFAVNSGTACTFFRGDTTCTTVHGSHGTESEHNGQVHSSGKTTKEPTPCKVTGKLT